MLNNTTQFSKDFANGKMTIVREFAAPVEHVWNAWTQSELLDQWWAPKPWKAETKSMDFAEGGFWLYAMVGPDNTKHWGRVDYEMIDTKKCFVATDCFCDEDGNAADGLPRMNWKIEFQAIATGTRVVVQILFNDESDMRKVIEMGVEAGFSAALENLGQLLLELQTA